MSKEVAVSEYDYSKGNGAAYIVCAACKVGDIIFAGARHWDSVMHTQLKALEDAGVTDFSCEEEQGFIDQFGNFYDRREAFELCHLNHQEVDTESNGSVQELYSEGLYKHR